LPKKNILSVIVPCYNESKTLAKAIQRIDEIKDDNLSLEIIIVDDCSKDSSFEIAQELASKNNYIKVIKQTINRGKGAALREGFKNATGDFVAVNDADLEYDPQDLKKLLVPLINNQADVVIGSRFLSSGMHRVLYFWHSVGNKFLTLLSNMFTDLNLTDMESCYKVFRNDVIRSIELKENRFGFEPEIVAKVAHKRLRIFEMGISYYGRTYEEGKKIGFKDAIRAFYCILKYNANHAPIPIQLLIYLFIGGISAIVNYIIFILLFNLKIPLYLAVTSAFFAAAILNYILSISILFRHKARWNSSTELVIYFISVVTLAILDFIITSVLIQALVNPKISKLISTATLFILNFLARKLIVFPETSRGPWKPQNK
jgi:glycosyltransferase involved in cell wall biosynthesis